MSAKTTALTAVEGIKARSNFLRGSIVASLADTATGALAPDDTQLSKFHGFYQQDDDSGVGDTLTHRNFEHVFLLLTTVLPREPLQVALRGISSPNAGLRGLALEYLESVLPPEILARLWQLVDVPPGDRPHLSPERALEELRVSTETPILKDKERSN